MTNLSWLVQFQRAGSSFSTALLGGIYSFSAGEGRAAALPYEERKPWKVRRHP